MFKKKNTKSFDSYVTVLRCGVSMVRSLKFDVHIETDRPSLDVRLFYVTAFRTIIHINSVHKK